MSEAFAGDYVDLRFVKSRKVAQIVMEIPIEQATAFVAAFGAPDPSTGIPVAIARLQEPSAKAEKPKRNWNELSRAEQAGIACEDQQFGIYLQQKYGFSGEAAFFVRAHCVIKSRADLNTDRVGGRLWDQLYSDYQLWKRGCAA